MELKEGQKFLSTETIKLAKQEYNKDIIIKFVNSRTTIGQCRKHLGTYILRFSNRYIELLEKDKLINLIIHELSHIPFPNHKKNFKNECQRLGKILKINFTENYKLDLSLNQYNHIYQCGNCGEKLGRVRPLTPKSVHSVCYNKLKKENNIVSTIDRLNILKKAEFKAI